MFDIHSALRKRAIAMSRESKRRVFLILDMLLIPSAVVIALLLGGGSLASIAAPRMLLTLAVMLGFGCSAILALGLPRIKLNAFEQSAILKTAAMAAIVAMAGWVFWKSAFGGMAPFSPIILWMTLTLMAVMTRIFIRHALHAIYVKGQHRNRVLIYGAGQTGTQLALALQTDDTLEAVAFVDDNSTLQRMVVAGLRVYSPINITKLVRDMQINRVVLAMPSNSPTRQAQILRRLKGLDCDVRIMPSFARLVGEGELLDQVQPVDPNAFLNRSGRSFDRTQIEDTYCGQTVLISGAGGSIGSELCRQLMNSRPARLVLLDISEAALYQIDRELRDSYHDRIEQGALSIRPVIGSVCDRARMDRLLAEERPSVVLHAAAYKHVPLVEQNLSVALHNNSIGTRTLAEAARAAGVKRFVLVSTDKAVRPTNVMGATKRLAELGVQDLATRPHDTLFSIVRFGNVLGSSGSVIPLFEEQIARGGPVTVTHPEVTRYFMTISEAAQLVLLAGSYAKGGEVYVLEMGKPVSILSLARQLIKDRGYSIRDADNPDGEIELSFTGLRPGEKLHEELLIGNETEPTENSKIMRAREELLSELEYAAAMQAAQKAIEAGEDDAVRQLLRRFVAGFDDMSPLPSLPALTEQSDPDAEDPATSA